MRNLVGARTLPTPRNGKEASRPAGILRGGVSRRARGFRAVPGGVGSWVALLAIACVFLSACAEDGSVCQLDYHVFSLAVSPDGKRIAAGGIMAGFVTIIDAETMQVVTKLKTKGGPANSVTFSPDGRYLAAGVGAMLSQLGINVWETEKWQRLERFELPNVPGRNTSTSLSVAFSPDGKSLAAGNKSFKNGGIDIWNVESGKIEKTLPCEMSYVRSIAYSGDGTYIAAGQLTWDTVELWDVSTGVLIRKLRTRKKATVEQLAFTRPEGYLISALEEWHPTYRGGAIQVWHPESAQLVRTLDWEPKDDKLSGVCVGPEGGWLVASTQETFVRMWNYRDGSVSRILTGHPYKLSNAIACDPRGRYVVAGGGTYVKIWRL